MILFNKKYKQLTQQSVVKYRNAFQPTEEQLEYIKKTYKGKVRLSYAPGLFVDDEGNVYSFGNDGKLFKRHTWDVANYLGLTIGKHFYYVHRLVARAFVSGESDELNEVNHKDLNTYNNNINNLEWVTRQQNMQHYFTNVKEGKGKQHLTVEDYVKIRELLALGYEQKKIAKMFDTTQAMISYIKSGYRTHKEGKGVK